MKRIIAVLMTITLAIGLCSCGKDAEPAAVPILTAEQIRAAETASVRELAEKLAAEMQAGTLTAESEWEGYVSEKAKNALTPDEKSEYMKGRELSLYAMPAILSFTVSEPKPTEDGLYSVTVTISYANGVTKPVRYTFAADGFVI